jgi:hypothetical protein
MPSFNSFRFAALASLATLAASAVATPARADAPRAHAFALVVGDNAGGSGQQPLRFAEDDARRLAQVLVEIGHYGASDVRVVLHPSAAQLLASVDEVAARARAAADRGDPTQVLFYFSGHARANAVDLGTEELALSTLRDRLRAVPSTLTIVILDACQSGSFSRVKGAEPAADFSYNSVSGITQRGLAVMASSTGEELSQESDELKGSYFTHHLVTGLRGAGDADGDGRVSLDEAYRYAYRRTLASTARTQVGEQHVTLETDLAGQGEIPVTYPAEARAQLGLPAPLDGRVLVQQRTSGAVLADVQKVAGAPVKLALVAGAYDAVVSQKTGIVECRVTLVDGQPAEIDPTTCTPVTPDRTASKGEDEAHPRYPYERDRWAIEGSFGVNARRSDGYTDRLAEFGYERKALEFPSLRFSVGASRVLVPHLAAVLQATTLAGGSFQRSIGDETDTVSLQAYGLGLYLRSFLDLDSWLGVYGQAGVGGGLGFVTLKTQQTGVPPSNTDVYGGYMLGGAVGLTASLRRVCTFFVQGSYDYAPLIHDLIGDTHDDGGFSAEIGMRFRLGDDR